MGDRESVALATCSWRNADTDALATELFKARDGRPTPIPYLDKRDSRGGTPMTAGKPDQDSLVVRVGQGDRAALRLLYDAVAPRLMGIAIRMLGRRDLAEDTLQEAFVAIWSAAPHFDPARGNARAWLATILRRKAIDRLRASPWLLRRKAEVTESCTVPADDMNALAVRQCLYQLRETHRSALLLVYYFGLTHEELSRRLDRPLGTVKTWIRRGLLELKECLYG